MHQIAVPQAVIAEVGAKTDGDRTLQTVRLSASFVIVDDETPPVDILSWNLGAGETQVITGAIVHAADRVVIGDLEARRCAKAMGLALIGTLGTTARIGKCPDRTTMMAISVARSPERG